MLGVFFVGGGLCMCGGGLGVVVGYVESGFSKKNCKTIGMYGVYPVRGPPTLGLGGGNPHF